MFWIHPLLCVCVYVCISIHTYATPSWNDAFEYLSGLGRVFKLHVEVLKWASITSKKSNNCRKGFLVLEVNFESEHARWLNP
jgi:hypothetical protein